MAQTVFYAQKIDDRIRQELKHLIEQNRERCLWFLNPEYEPSTVEDALRILKYLQRYGNREVYTKARNLAAKMQSAGG